MYTIDADNNIATVSEGEAIANGLSKFNTKEELHALIVNGVVDPVEAWNGFAGSPGFDDLKDVKKFENREAAARRIWDAIQRQQRNGAEASNTAEAEGPATPKPARVRKAQGDGMPKPQRVPKAAKPKKEKVVKPKKEKVARKPRESKADSDSKKAEVIRRMKLVHGITLADMVAYTGWQKHTCRGFVSILGSKGGEKVISDKNSAGERRYRIE